ncbi:hypothetical protein [Cereibacter sediminicola]|uniref:hypothetical protein n=1 Tax=Cereibacter sediminicola TaxID=2584941 RepID=UPI0011A3F552|nr:hypothetical protein [Cereibacter sediminicola]
MSEVEIRGLTRVARPKPNRAGFTILAFFDCAARGLALYGCALVRTPKNGMVAWPPKIEAEDGMRRRVEIEDDSLRHAMMLHAREAYRALGGTDAEWIGKSIPMGPRPEDRDGLNRFLQE